MNTSIPFEGFPGVGRFLVDYATAYSRVARWFHYDPHDPASIERRLAEIDGRAPLQRDPMRVAVMSQQERWGAGEAAMVAASALGKPGTYAVVTGQQVGLFGGPLYTQFKAVCVIKTARRLAKQFPDRRFVPTFWMASGDSDIDEVRVATVLNREGSPQRIGLPPLDEELDGTIVSALDNPHGIAGLIGELEKVLPGGNHRDEVLNDLGEAYAAGNLVEGFASWMARLFRETELVLIDPQDPALAQAAWQLMRDEMATCDKGEVKLRSRNKEILDEGYELQVDQPEGDTNLFMLDERLRREKIICAGDHYQLRPSDRRIEISEMHGMAEQQPQRFVAGVMLRPIYQNILFPVAAFVGGGAEISYRAQATALFEHHGQQMAPAYMRSSATIVTPKFAQLLSDLGWSLADCFAVPQELAAKAVGDEIPPEITAAVSDYRRVLETADADLKRSAVTIDPNLEKSFATLRGNLERHVEKLERKITSAVKHRNEKLLSQVERLQSMVYPFQVPQERELSLLSFLPRYGFAVIRALLDQLADTGWRHQLVVLD